MAQTQTATLDPRPAVWLNLLNVLRHRRSARLLSVVLFLLAWQIITPMLRTQLIPMPAEVLGFMWDEIRGDTLGRTTVWEAFYISLRRLGAGFAMAFAIGVPIGLLMGVSRWTERMLRDFVLVGLAMPSLVWALLTGIWFGLDSAAPIITVVLAGTPFVIINTVEGVHDVPRELSDMARSFNVPRREVIRHVVFPSLLPFFFASLRYGLANGWKGLVLAEVFAATSGAGWNISYWRDAGREQGVIGYALFFIICALFVERVIFERFARWAFRWRPSDDEAQPDQSQLAEA